MVSLAKLVRRKLVNEKAGRRAEFSERALKKSSFERPALSLHTGKTENRVVARKESSVKGAAISDLWLSKIAKERCSGKSNPARE